MLLRVASLLEGGRPARRAHGHGPRVTAGLLTLGAATIHFSVAPVHFQEYLLFGVFFAVLGCLQVALAGALLVAPTPRVLAFGAGLSLGVVALWAASRTTGLPIGPEAWRPE